jgi:AcrR family transcriptional regulator
MSNRERVLNLSLALFNEHGIAHVSSLQITTELEISPGNLYYHFRNKDDIAKALVQEFEQALKVITKKFSEQVHNLDDYPDFLFSLMTLLSQYRFVLRDLETLTLSDPNLKRCFNQLFLTLRSLNRLMINHLQKIKAIKLNKQYEQFLSENSFLVAIGSINQITLQPPSKDYSHILRQGVSRLVALIQPYLATSTNS